MSELFDIYGLIDNIIIESEEKICTHTIFILYTLVQRIVNKLGLQETFCILGSRNTVIMESPDFSWITDTLNIPHLIVVVSLLFTICIYNLQFCVG